MMEWRHLPNAPIREALLNIQTVLPSSVRLKHLEEIHKGIADRYPKKRPRTRLEGSIDLSSGQFTATPATVDGYVFLSEDQRHVVQVRLDGFTVNKLKPYATWEVLRDEARVLWDRYIAVARPEEIRRVALRYIILDIDVILQEVLAPEDPALWAKFEQLRDLKNEIFFHTITPKAEALFQ